MIKDSVCYRLIQDHYGLNRAKRSGVLLMNHIDEGLLILEDLKATVAARSAYCLHPLLQNDRDLSNNYCQVLNSGVDAYTIMLAMEYRSVANEYLSEDVNLHMVLGMCDHIRLSPIKEVNDMLIADKVQNCKDFVTYHKGTHPRTEYLERYFDQWLRKLGVSSVEYQRYCDSIEFYKIMQTKPTTEDREHEC